MIKADLSLGVGLNIQIQIKPRLDFFYKIKKKFLKKKKNIFVFYLEKLQVKTKSSVFCTRNQIATFSKKPQSN